MSMDWDTSQLQKAVDGCASAFSSTHSVQALDDARTMLSALAGKSVVAASAYARWFRTRAEDAAVDATLDDAEKLVASVERMLQAFAASDFDSYMLYMEWGRQPDRQFYRPRRDVLLPVVMDLQDLYDGRIDFLSVSLPPRVGKSTMCIFFLTFVMGNRPERANVMSGHSDRLTKGFHQEALSIITDRRTYRFAEVFPDAKVVHKSMADETISLKVRSRFPTLTCRSIDGTLTGAVEVGRGGLLYCDDLVSDREEALNSARMDKLYAAYLNQLRDRMNDGARQLFVATRWVPNDPIGRIMDLHSGNPRYRFAVIPALGEDGESNFQYRQGKGFSTEHYVRMRDELEEAGEGDSWDAKFMGAPRWIGGLMFPRDALRYYGGELPEGEPDAVVAVCDTKDRGPDYACLPVAYLYGADCYIHDVVCDNGLPEAVEPRIVDAIVRNKASLVRFESNAAGGRVADDVRRWCAERGHVVDVRKKYSTENKETRILVDSEWVKVRCVFRSDEPGPDYARFMQQLCLYTTEGKVSHDDAPDAMSMLRRLVQSMTKARVEPARRII